MSLPRRFEIPLFLLVVASLLVFLQWRDAKPYEFAGDDLQYLQYSASLYEHGVFGLQQTGENAQPPPPGNANAPFYPALVAGWMFLDQPFAASVLCVVKKGKDAGCELRFKNAQRAQLVLALISVFLIYLTALRLSRNRPIAWLAALLSLASGVFTEFTGIFMTEILLLPAFFLLLYLCLVFYEDKKLTAALCIGLMLGFLTLTRPSYLYLFYAFVGFFAVLTAMKRDKGSLINLLAVIAAFIVFVSPWAIRNKIQFDNFTLTTGSYAEKVLAERTNYNQMSWPEVGVAMIYWLPDFGDSVARKIFPPELTEKLGWQPGSYYSQKYQRAFELEEELGSRDKVLGHLIRHEVLTPKHVAVSVPLAMRGALIAKYWGLLGFLAFAAHLVCSIRRKDYRLLIMSLPLWFMVAFHAGVSVSIPRYNLALMLPYAISLGWVIHSLGVRLVKKTARQ